MRHKTVANPLRPASPQSTHAAVRFNIDRITLHGYSRAEQRRFQSSLETHLIRLADDASRRVVKNHTLKHLDAGQLPAGTTPEAAALHIAERIVATLGREGVPHA